MAWFDGLAERTGHSTAQVVAMTPAPKLLGHELEKESVPDDVARRAAAS
jgi:hypothetical protein